MDDSILILFCFDFVIVAVHSSSLTTTPPPPPPPPSSVPIISTQFAQPNNQRIALLSSISSFDPNKLKKISK